MPSKLTQEQVIARMTEKHKGLYDYSKFTYANNRSKSTIICKTHGDFQMCYHNHYVAGQGCRSCGITASSEKRKMSQEEFIQRSMDAHKGKYSYDKVVYVNTQTQVIVTCPVHGDFKQIAGHHLNGIGCRKCFDDRAHEIRLMTTEEFVTKAKSVHGDKYDYSNTVYVRNMQKVGIVCRTHGEFWQLANDHLSKKAGCPACAGVKRLTQESFMARSKSLWGDKYDYSEAVYKGFEKKVILTCDQGHRFEQLVSSHLNGFNCPHCSGLARKTTEEFVAQAKQTHGDLYDYSKVEYLNSKTPVVIICKEHGDFKQAPIHHILGSGCQRCTQFGFRMDLPGTLYYLKVADEDKVYYKIGITNRTVNERFIKSDITKITVLATWLYESGKECSDKETEILREFKQHLVPKGTDVLSSGNSELFTIDVLRLDI